MDVALVCPLTVRRVDTGPSAGEDVDRAPVGDTDASDEVTVVPHTLVDSGDRRETSGWTHSSCTSI